VLPRCGNFAYVDMSYRDARNRVIRPLEARRPGLTEDRPAWNRPVSLRELVRRRVPHVVGVYLAAAWGLLEFSDWVTHRFGLTDRLVVIIVVLLLAGLPVAAGLAWRKGAALAAGPVIPPADRPPHRSIAVLPFANLSAGDDNDHLSDGLTDEIIVALTKVEELRVASRTSSFAFRDRPEDVRMIGRALNVESVLEGSVQRSADRLRVSARLVDVRDGYHLWSETFDREMEDVFAIEDEIARSVVHAMRVILGDSARRALVQLQPSDVRAYEFYLRGRQFFHQARKKSLQYAREMFEHAIDIDPEYARAWAGISDASAFLNLFYPTEAGDLARADEASLRALALAPDLAEAHSSRGLALFLMKHLEKAELELRKAIELDPRLFEARYFYGRACFQQGRFEDSARLFGEANALREDYQAAFFAAQFLAALGHTREAEDAYRVSLQVAERHMEFNPDHPRAATMRAVSLCRLGRAGDGLYWAERALAIDPEDAGVRYNVACLFALEGKVDRAFECLRDAIRAGFGNRDWICQDPDLANLRSDPRFETLFTAA